MSRIYPRRSSCHQPRNHGQESGTSKGRYGQEGCRGEECAAGDRHAQQIAAELAESHELPKKQAEAILGDLEALSTRQFKQGDKSA
jgi:hypothetical protein